MRHKHKPSDLLKFLSVLIIIGCFVINPIYGKNYSIKKGGWEFYYGKDKFKDDNKSIKYIESPIFDVEYKTNNKSYMIRGRLSLFVENNTFYMRIGFFDNDYDWLFKDVTYRSYTLHLKNNDGSVVRTKAFKRKTEEKYITVDYGTNVINSAFMKGPVKIFIEEDKSDNSFNFTIKNTKGYNELLKRIINNSL